MYVRLSMHLRCAGVKRQSDCYRVVNNNFENGKRGRTFDFAIFNEISYNNEINVDNRTMVAGGAVNKNK